MKAIFRRDRTPAEGRAAARVRMARAAGAMLVAIGALAATGAAAGEVNLDATYYISISGLTVGRAQVEGRFTETQYATAISGTTFGISRFVTDASARLSGNGHLSGSKVVPSTYNLDTREGDLATIVRMAMKGGAVTSVEAYPRLVEAADRIPIRRSDKRDVVDPLGAFLVSINRDRQTDGKAVCNRTVRVFDGWQRFDVRLFYQHTRDIRGAYTGKGIVCGARYVPVAGHRPGRPVVEYMTGNKRLEVWMVPIEGTDVMVPYNIVIGTAIGDLMITAREFAISDRKRQAAAVQ